MCWCSDLHCASRSSIATAGEFVITVVRFFAAPGLPARSVVSMPSMQKSNLTTCTPSSWRICWMAFIIQDAAPAGCSKTNSRPFACCS